MTPFLVYKPWGGTRLAQLKNVVLNEDELLGETWEVSRLREGPTLDANGLSLETLSESQLPYLVKFIDTTEPLSVQVHPHDEYARKFENSSGKTECWIILQADADAGIYLGFKPGVTKDQFFKAVEDQSDLTSLLQFHPVKAGDFFYVPAGSVHAIGAGITLAEVQQSSGVTYRVWDWNRVDKNGKGRELHVVKAKDVLNFDEEANTLKFFKNKNIFSSRSNPVIEHPQFKVSYHAQEIRSESVGVEQRVVTVMSLDQAIELETQNLKVKIEPYRCALVETGSTVNIRGGHFLVVE